MKLQLIMLPQPILVSDEEIKNGINAFYCHPSHNFPDGGMITKIENIKYSDYKPYEVKHIEGWGVKEGYKKIIAGIPELPSINFSALSEEDCKKIGWVDVEKLAEDFGGNGKFLTDKKYGFREGFKAAQSLNEKKFSEEDVLWVMNLAYANGVNNKGMGRDFMMGRLSQPKVFDVEVEMEELFLEEDSLNYTHEKNDISGSKWFPKITNNSIRVIKIISLKLK